MLTFRFPSWRTLFNKSGKAFARVFAIKPGEKRAVTLSVSWRELSVLRGSDLERVVEASARTVYVGGGQPHEFVGGVSAKFATVESAAHLKADDSAPQQWR